MAAFLLGSCGSNQLDSYTASSVIGNEHKRVTGTVFIVHEHKDNSTRHFAEYYYNLQKPMADAGLITHELKVSKKAYNIPVYTSEYTAQLTEKGRIYLIEEGTEDKVYLGEKKGHKHFVEIGNMQFVMDYKVFQEKDSKEAEVTYSGSFSPSHWYEFRYKTKDEPEYTGKTIEAKAQMRQLNDGSWEVESHKVYVKEE